MAFDLAIVNTQCYTMDPQQPAAEAVGIKGNLIDAVGTDREIEPSISTNTRVIDGEGKALLPGFNDAHTHFASMGTRISEYLELGDVASRNELFGKVKEEVEKTEPGEWIAGVGWDESKWEGDKKFMTKEELDEIAPSNPLSLQRVDGHISCVNSEALEKLDLEPTMDGFEIEDGEPTGRLMEEARFAIRKETEPGLDAVIRGIKQATEQAHRLGVTSIQDAHVDRKKFRAYLALWNEGKLSVRSNVFFGHEDLENLRDLGLQSGFGDHFLSLGGLKLFADGSIGAKTAWVNDGYLDAPDNHGIPIWKTDELGEIMKQAHSSGLQVAVHAIGDRAIGNVIDKFAALGPNLGRMRHRIEHCEMITRQELARLKQLDILPSMQPNFIGEWGMPGGMYEDRFPATKVSQLNPLAWIVEEEIPFSAGSDCMPFEPVYGIHSAVNTPHPAQRISPKEALYAYTAG
ncbi:MAG: amidohydrolase, partial [Candidatus Bipolaricaulota bacterium]